jgi:subtilisin family serine protease
MKTSYSILIFIFFTLNQIIAQNYQQGKLWVSVLSDDARKADDNYTKNSELNEILTQFNVDSYDQIMWFAKTPSLRDIYEIDCQCNELELKDVLEQHFTNIFSFVEQIPILVQAYEPEDYMWTDHQDWIWHLPKIQADSAWDITIGNPQIRIGIVEEGIDIEHSDLASQISPYYDPYSGEEFISWNLFKYGLFQGTTVASFAAARTAETGTNPTPNGQLASIGFNTKLVGYYNLGMPRVLHASTVMGVDVVNCSWMSMGSISPSLDSIYQNVINEVIGNGTVLVAAAGNGFCSSWYNDTETWFFCDSVPLDFDYFSAPYPLNPKYDSTIILVTSTDSLDNHTLFGDTVVNRTHSHFPEVDICSPGHILMGATLTYHVDEITGDTVKNEWPYFGRFGGTSFATPIVSGVCALIKSVNPCLTPAQVEEIIKLTADPVNDENLYPGLLGAGRINAYNAVKYAQENYGYEDFTIGNGQDITWINDIQARKIIIEPGGKLTIKSSVFMLPGSDIIVEKGGNLVIDSGFITTCKGLWNGIQVRGRIDLDQYSFSNQGHLTLINGATIENAMTGVILVKIDSAGCDPYSSGGIIQAINANFINCANGVSFYPYENFLNDKRNIKNNLSYLEYCNFKLDTTYYHVFNSPKQFIFMESVRGISIKGCRFINEIKSSDYEDVTLIDPDLMVGITSLNSSFLVDEYCLHQIVPCDTSVGCRFENLNYGIYAMNFGSEKFPVINKSEFYRNKTGVYLGAINNAVVTSNYFHPESTDTTGLDPLILGGLYLDYCNAYQVEENEFDGYDLLGGTQGAIVGLVVNNSGPYANEVYKNDFSHLDYGLIAMNNNKRDSVGLCIKCNNFAFCDYDISVVVDSSSTGWGIASNQGSRDTIPTAPAGNIFTTNFTNHVIDLYNDNNAYPFTYFHHYDITYMTPNLEPDYYSQSVSPSLNRQWYDPDESCPSHLVSGGGSSLEKSVMEEAEFEINSLEEILLANIDGGNTQNLTDEVINSTPPEALELSEQLLTQSPYLSDTVLKSAIEKEDVLANSMIRDILVENPQSAKSDEIMSLLDERIDPMPEYMKEQIAQGKFTTGEKENLEARQSYFLSARSQAFNNLNRIYQSDSTVAFRLDSLANLFDEMSSLENKYRKMFIHLENGDTAEATSILTEVPADFQLTIEQSNIHQKYESLSGILKDLPYNNVSALNLDSAQIASLLDIYDNETLPGIYARNMLLIAGYLSYQEPYLFPDELKKMEVKPGSIRDDYKEPVKINIFPNPAAYYTIVDFDIRQDVNTQDMHPQVQINIYDLRGTLQQTLKSNQKRDQLVLDVRDLKSGLYLVELYCNGLQLSSSKLIVNR